MFDLKSIHIENADNNIEGMFGLMLHASRPWPDNPEFQEFMFLVLDGTLQSSQLRQLQKIFKPDKSFIDFDKDRRETDGHPTVSLLFRHSNIPNSFRILKTSEKQKETLLNVLKDLIFVEKRAWGKDGNYTEHTFKMCGEYECVPQSIINQLQKMLNPHEIEVYIDQSIEKGDLLLVGIIFEHKKIPKNFSDYVQSDVEPETSLE